MFEKDQAFGISIKNNLYNYKFNLRYNYPNL